LVDFLLGERPKGGVRALEAIQLGSSDDAYLQLALFEVDRQDGAECGDGQLDYVLPATVGMFLVLEFFLEEVERLLRLGAGRRGLVADVVACWVTLVELGAVLGVERDERRGDA